MSRREGEEPLEQFFSRVQPRLQSTLARFRIPAGDAESLLEDILLTLVYKRDSICSPERWLMRTVRSRCMMYWRRRRLQLYSSLDTALQESVRDARDPAVARELEAVLATLPLPCKALLRERYGLGSSGDASPQTASAAPAELERCLASLGQRLVERGLLTPDGRKPG